MRKGFLSTAVTSLMVIAGFGWNSANAADLTWEVVNPFRLYKQSKSFSLHENAFKAVRGEANSPMPADIIQRVERCLNDPDPASPWAAACRTLPQSMDYSQRLGWAAKTLDDTCYDRSARPRRYATSCLREGHMSQENFVLPQSHAVSIGLSPEQLANAGNGDCTWGWKRRSGGAPSQPLTRRCSQKVLIPDVPYARDRASSGLLVETTLPNGNKLSEEVVVDDVFVVALGDSFASGEGNPDKPVTFSSKRAFNYYPNPDRAVAAERFDDGSYVLPKRLMADEEHDKIFDYTSPEFREAFWSRSAAWLSPECHRSQYAFPFRVALQIAIEDRHRAVTLATFGCSGSEVINGLFKGMSAREHWDASPNKTNSLPPQFDQLTSLICNTDVRVTSNRPLKVFAPGSTQATTQQIALRSCPANQRKRDIDLVLLSIGGNDVGFSQIAAYTFLDSVSDIAAVARVRESQLRFGPNVGQVYLATLDSWLDAVSKALKAGFGVDPGNVIHASYEQALFDEQGRPCGEVAANATTGMDVHSKFRFNGDRVKEASRFTTELLERLQCIAKPGPSCHGQNPAGGGTGFTLVTEHQQEFLRRGVCARGPQNANSMKMPRLDGSSGFEPYLPSSYRPYAHHQRLLRTPNDGFLTANEHKGDETPLVDILQPAIAALYSGAFHPTAEAHALVADHVMPYVRKVLRRSEVIAADNP